MLLASALLFVWNLAQFHIPSTAAVPATGRQVYAASLHPTGRVPAVLNGFTTWNWVLLLLMVVAYGWPVAQFLVTPSPGAVVHRVFGVG